MAPSLALLHGRTLTNWHTNNPPTPLQPPHLPALGTCDHPQILQMLKTGDRENFERIAGGGAAGGGGGAGGKKGGGPKKPNGRRASLSNDVAPGGRSQSRGGNAIPPPSAEGRSSRGGQSASPSEE